MYKYLIKPFLFLFQPEKVHYFITDLLTFFSAIPGFSFLLRSCYVYEHPHLERKLFGLTFKNPVGLAAGFDKDARWFNELANFGFGFIEIGTLTPKAQIGNPKPRLFRITKDEGLINRMGFNNLGVEDAVKRLKNRKTNLIIGGNIGKNTATPNDDAFADYLFDFKILHDYVDYFVVNVSCPNVKDLTKLQDTPFLLALLGELKRINTTHQHPKPILLKIAPDLNNSQLDEIIELVAQTKIDGIIATNTTTSRENLKTDKKTIEAIANGGLSGLPLKNRSTDVIRYLAEKSNKAFPIIGVGGIQSPEDALEKLNAGADLIQIYTGFIYEGPVLVKKINKAIVEKNKKYPQRIWRIHKKKS
ncbi:MAG: dihydroorotate dehydrogenase (quinone) [Flavobacteriales bacterium CG_4_10_14_0_2_um_filter_32_8]|nr:MAG: dihydroorotate dehydrogenase (quinone) [Flavobacteriales bacterium CG_4_10_14_0_2_um_filter_32_8]PJB14318.1 MAG: dihydroorotate dehydrogenase (quinone) [Flavobacteriales bacterium CG_4_9_14_3_um_filter_32_8]